MAIELAGIQLNRVHRVVTLEQSALVYHRVPGLEGNLTQALGRDSVQLQIEGIFFGATAADDLEALRAVYKKRAPVDFLAEIIGQAYFGQVLLDRFEVRQWAQEPEQFSYTLVVAEYVVPPQPQTAAPAVGTVDAAIATDAQGFMDSVSHALAALDGLSVPDFGDPTPPLRGTLDGVHSALDGLSGVTSAIDGLFGGT